MYIICYEDTNTGTKTFIESDSPEIFAKNNPQAKIMFCFDKTNDEIMKQSDEIAHFRRYAYIYGFSENDYGLMMIDSKNRILKLTGFNPRNNKYKCNAIEIRTGRRYKMTPQYARTCALAYNTLKTSGQIA